MLPRVGTGADYRAYSVSQTPEAEASFRSSALRCGTICRKIVVPRWGPARHRAPCGYGPLVPVDGHWCRSARRIASARGGGAHTTDARSVRSCDDALARLRFPRDEVVVNRCRSVHDRTTNTRDQGSTSSSARDCSLHLRFPCTERRLSVHDGAPVSTPRIRVADGLNFVDFV